MDESESDDVYRELEERRKKLSAELVKKKEKRGFRETSDFKSAIKKYIKSSGLKWASKNTEIYDAWGRVAGEEISEFSRVSSFKNGILTIEVDSSALLGELESFYKDSLLQSLKEEVPESQLRQLKFRLSGKK